MRLFEAVLAGGIVVVRSYRFRNSPISDCEFGIEFSRTLERACRLIMIEIVNQTQSLIEELLRFGIAG